MFFKRLSLFLLALPCAKHPGGAWAWSGRVVGWERKGRKHV